MRDRLAHLCALPLRGGGGEPVSFARTVHSHGCARLAPAAIEEEPLRYRRTVRVGRRIVALVMREEGGNLVVDGPRHTPKRDVDPIAASVRRMFRLDDDLSEFYASIAKDPLLRWASSGAGRLLASPTVFEDVIKTICTTNCAWSGTVRMTDALAVLGGGAFPEPQTLAQTPPQWFRDVARMGYRGAYVREIARRACDGTLDLEGLLPKSGLGDDAVAETLLALPGIGPYAAAHVMQLLGRHRQLVLDSWTRPTYLRLAKKKRAKDTAISRAFARYGDYAGLAFWLYLTEGWLDGANAIPLTP